MLSCLFLCYYILSECRWLSEWRRECGPGYDGLHSMTWFSLANSGTTTNKWENPPLWSSRPSTLPTHRAEHNADRHPLHWCRDLSRIGLKDDITSFAEEAAATGLLWYWGISMVGVCTLWTFCFISVNWLSAEKKKKRKKKAVSACLAIVKWSTEC